MGGGSKGRLSPEEELRTVPQHWPKDEIGQIMMRLLASDEPNRDREFAIVGAELLSRRLEQLIGADLLLKQPAIKYLFDSDGPFATMSVKIKLGHKLGLYDTTSKTNLDRVRIIRNVFAHAVADVAFDHPKVSAVCSRFTAQDGWITEIPSLPTTPRRRFAFAVTSLDMMICRTIDARLESHEFSNAAIKLAHSIMTPPRTSPEKSAPPDFPPSQSSENNLQEPPSQLQSSPE